MLANLSVVLAVLLLGLPLAALLLLKLMPTPILNWADRRAARALDVEAYNKASPYNKPGFKPVHSTCSGAAIEVTGAIPADLEGVFLRNGTNLQFDQTNGRYHMFNGAGMLHQVQIAQGKATYSTPM